VPRFHSTNTDQPVTQNAPRASSSSAWPRAIAVDSSMTRCAASARAGRRPRSSGATTSPYAVLRAPSSSPLPTAVATPPPAATTPMNANCDPPVKTSSDMAHVCATVRPAPTASTPNDTP
jgi:hypothetical protein